MITLSYWDTITKTIGSRLPINVNGIRVISLAMDLNQAYILDVEINPALQDLWCQIADNEFAGLVIQSDDCTIGFVKSNEREERYIRGRHVIRFYSSIWNLSRCSLQYQTGYATGNSLQEYITAIDPDINWVFLSGDQSFNFDAGVPTNNFELLRDICFANGWSFRENGIDADGRTQILVGDFRDIKEFDSTGKYEPLDITYDPGNEFAPTKWSCDKVYLEDMRATYNRNYSTHIYIYSNPIEGFNSDSITEFESGFFSFTDPNYPIVQLADGRFYIQNTSAYNNIEQSKILNRTIQYQQQTSLDLYASNDPLVNDIEYDEEDILEQMYNHAVAQLRRNSEQVTYSFTIRYLDLVLPGTCINIKTNHWAKDYDGWQKQVFKIDETRYARNILYNEQELAALIE